MIGQIRNSVFTKILWGLMGLYLLNISVDPADPYSNYISEDLSINDQESIVEIVLEQILGYENIIKEYDDNDTEDHNTKTNFKIDLVIGCAIYCETHNELVKGATQIFLFINTFFITAIYQIDTPPPQI